MYRWSSRCVNLTAHLKNHRRTQRFLDSKGSIRSYDFFIASQSFRYSTVTKPSYRQVSTLASHCRYVSSKVQPMVQSQHGTSDHTYIALGSNVGDRVHHIEEACAAMRRRGIQITRTSHLYETEPMYYEDQERFLNGVCEARTTLEPLQLLDTLKEVEAALGRRKTIEKGPRTIDLDILLYKNMEYRDERLTIPHLGIPERPFVLKPLCE